MNGSDVEIRMLTEVDSTALTRLAQRDSATVPAGPLLGASVAGRLIAVRSLATGDAIADPFIPTADVQEILQVRAGQLRADRSRGDSALSRLFRRRSRAALPSSPPGAGGRLLRI